MDCARCHTPLPDEARFCFSCGSDISAGGTPTLVRPRDVTAELQDRLTRVLAGRYVVKQLLGAGGMGAVFLADDLTLERPVAIKVLPPDMSSDERVVARFQREAKTAAKLDHSHIIPIYRVESESGLHYFVMKYVPGQSLESMLRDGAPLDIPFALRVLADAASALGHAHARGVVHRDVKPANIMLDADDRVVLTDFGISKAGNVTAQLTQTGMIIGTPHYMAPEQAMGREVDGRADQYALAVVGYQLLTGKLLFDGESAHTIIFRHVSEEAPRVVQLRSEVPTAVDAALARALAKEPEERFTRMEDFVAALRSEVPVAVPPHRPATRAMNAPTVRLTAPAPRRRRSRRLALLATGMLLTAASGAGAWIARDRAPAPVVSAAADSAATRADSQTVVAREAAPAPVRRDSAVVTANSDTVPPDDLTTPRAPRRRPLAQGPVASRLRNARVARQGGSDATTEARRTAPLTVASEPYGTLYVDGVEVGDTPVANHPLPVGHRVELRVEREGYRTKRESILIKGPNAIRRRYVLEAGETP
jgi:hypothetical protein